MPEKDAAMSIKRGKLTAGKARERIASLEESIAARQHRLEQLQARLDRSESPDERLLTAKSRLERRLDLERDQLAKLVKLLGREQSQPEESGEFFASEEIDDLHRSFEEIRQHLAQVQARVDSSDVPRDLHNRLSSFEDRVSRREEVDSELFGQVLSLQNALDQERQTVRRLSRRAREQEQSLDALREAVEDSVVATVDLAERLDELEETLGDNGDTREPAVDAPTFDTSAALRETTELRQTVAELQRAFERLQSDVGDGLSAAAEEREALRQGQAHDESSLLARDALSVVLARLEALEKVPLAVEVASGSQEADSPSSPRRPAVFSDNGEPGRKVAVFSRPQPSYRSH